MKAMRCDNVIRPSGAFGAYTKVFAGILAIKADSAPLILNPLTRGGTNLHRQLDDLASVAAGAPAACAGFLAGSCRRD